MHTRIGKTEISVDKVLQNLMVLDEYITYRNIVHREDDEAGTGTTPGGIIDEELYSSHSNYRSPDGGRDPNSLGRLAQIKGRLHLGLKAELSEDYLERMEVLKKQFVIDA